MDPWLSNLSVIILLVLALCWLFFKDSFRKVKETGPAPRKLGEGEAEILSHLPVGIAALSAQGKILWANGHFAALFGKNTAGLTMKRLLPDFSLSGVEAGREKIQVIHTGNKIFKTKIKLAPEEKGFRYLLTVEDITEQVQLYGKSLDTQPVMAFIKIDNLSEVLDDMPEEAKPHLLGSLERTLTEWAGNLEGYIKKTGEGRYIVFFTEWGLKQVEKTRFDILDKIRDIEMENPMPLTLSMGIGIGEENISELGRLAHSALDLALERGGDQVVIRSPEKVRFFGGKSTAMEKRTKVRARVTAYSLKELITQASQVIIMGHEMADYDSFGAAIGVAKAVQDLGRRAWVVIDDHNPAIDKLLNLLPKSPLLDTLVKTSQVQRVLNPDTLLIVVDTHKPSLLAEPKLINKAREVVVIDHHRRGEEFIAEAKLVYMETYASSTCELVTELLQYLGDQVEIGKFEATALLAGITVDTKNFIYQTGVRTFEAASYLRSVGAEPSIVQKILRDDMATVRKKAEVIRNARIICGQTALGVSREISPDAQLLAAKTADALLNIAEVNAAFVLWPFQGGTAISARSTGEVNVQAITERLGGGGHLTIAAAQVNDTLENTEKTLLQILEEVFCKEV